MDGITIAAAVCEIRRLVGAKIDKIQQPERDVIIISTKSGNGSARLLISASPDNGRIQLTESKYENPMSPPMFCMLMRKRILGGRILSVEQHSLDRLVVIEISAHNELGDSVKYKLIAEMMGKHSNIVLVNEKNIVIDAIRRIDISMSTVHPIFPGLSYDFLPVQDKKDPRSVTADEIFLTLSNGSRMDRQLSSELLGHSPDTARLLLFDAGAKSLLSEDHSNVEMLLIAKNIANVYSMLKDEIFSPCILLGDKNKAIGVAPFTPKNIPSRTVETLGHAIDIYYEEKDIDVHMHRKSAAMRKSITVAIERCERKIERIRDKMPSEETLEQQRIYGELLTTYSYCLKSGHDSVIVDNYYTEPVSKLEIPISPSISIAQNAQAYYKRYKKGKTALTMGDTQISEAKIECDYLNELMYSLDSSRTNAELDELEQELITEGYIRRAAGGKAKRSVPKTKPQRYLSSDGFEILVGRNSIQNEELTFKNAQPWETWLHAKNIPGSHVIIKGKEDTPEQTLFEAANIAAYNSKAKGGVSVPIDYTLRKFVKKLPGGKTGMVTYTNQKTVFITPDEMLVNKLLQQN